MRMSPMKPLPSSGLPAWPPLLATRGAGAASAAHAHHAMHFVLALEGELRVRAGNSRAISAAGVLTMPDVAHAIDARRRQVLIVFVDPESRIGLALRAATTGPIREISDGERRALLAGAEPMEIMREGGVAWTAAALRALGNDPAPPRAIHPKVRKLLALLQADSPVDDASLDGLARAVRLSPGRLMHAFTESIGIPLRPYLQWLKLQRAAAGIAFGLPLSDAAYRAGFSDAAHMSRTFRRMFGTPPSALRPARS
jgi:AraC-like DNA-binding protein